MTSIEGRTAIRNGLEFERSRQWLKAIEHYRKVRKQWPQSREFQSGLRRSKIHFGIARRYSDRSFESKLLRQSKREALALFDAILLQVRTQYVEPISSTSFVAHGTESLYVALANNKFRQHNLRGVDPDRIERLRKILRDEFWNKPIPHRIAARETVSRICEIAEKQTGLPASVVVLEYIFGGCNALDDYSGVLTPNRLDDLYGNIDGEFVGLGIEMKAETGEGMLLINVLPDSPAQRGGLKPDEHIIGIDGVDCRNMTTDEAARLLRGSSGSSVRLKIASAESPRIRVRVFQRQAVRVKSIPLATMVDRKAGIAYIRMVGFQKTSATELDAALTRLQQQGMRSLIWDVRGNPGGLLTAAVEVLDRFVADGVLVSTRGRTQSQNWKYSARRIGTWNLPLVLLVDGDSASASEIVAGAVRDHRRGTIVGRKTFGKWSVQSIFPVRNGTGLRLTTAKFYSPQGRTYGKVGISPDVVVKNSPRHV
ncbi:MAG: S41 family peptidase, partial [Planctomycetes bacterium]|nr:S41 family peptidase [Planctomycetota bacterium]